METPSFIERDLEAITNEMVADYEQRTGRVLYPAQTERLLINAFAYREMLIRERVQYAATQNLVDFANAPVLDYLGALVGVTRLASSRATVLVKFSFVFGHGAGTLPKGMRVSTTDGLVIFQLLDDYIIPIGVNEENITVECIQDGTVGNNYAINTLTRILDPVFILESVTNISVSGGGADQESDVELRERIKLATGSFSNAGSRGAYAYYTKTANPSIIDVAVLGPNDSVSVLPGEVHIYPLMADGSVTPPTVIDAVEEAVNDEKVRPLTDLVIVDSPTRINYTIEVDLTLYVDVDPLTIQSKVDTALTNFALEKRQELAQDIKLNKIISIAMVAGVYDVAVVSPVADIIVSEIEFGFCTGVTVNVIGTNNG